MKNYQKSTKNGLHQHRQESLENSYTNQSLEETEEQTEIRNRLTKETMRSEMKIMKIRIGNFKNKYEAIDQAMNSEIDKRFTDDSVKIMLKDQWKKDCMNEEYISEDIWKQKEEWLL